MDLHLTSWSRVTIRWRSQRNIRKNKSHDVSLFLRCHQLCVPGSGVRVWFGIDWKIMWFVYYKLATKELLNIQKKTTFWFGGKMRGWAQHTSRAPRRYTRLLVRLKRVNTRHLIFINTVVKTTMYLNILIYFK